MAADLRLDDEDLLPMSLVEQPLGGGRLAPVGAPLQDQDVPRLQDLVRLVDHGLERHEDLVEPL
jgi:hypothetical protein